MPNFNEISPSKESKQRLSVPITVVSRSISKNSRVAKHQHDWGQFVYAHHGVLSVVTAAARYVVPSEQGVWILPNIEHEVTALTEVQLTSFYFDDQCLEDLPKKSGVLSVNGFLKALILEANDITNDYLWSDQNGLLLRLILKKIATAPNVAFQLPYPKDSRLLTILASIQNDPSQTKRLEQWGKEVGASARTLSRLFKNETGLTYSLWRQRLNIQIAVNQLACGHSITNISLTLGYESPSAFIYMFKQNTGVSPSFYRLIK